MKTFGLILTSFVIGGITTTVWIRKIFIKTMEGN